MSSSDNSNHNESSPESSQPHDETIRVFARIRPPRYSSSSSSADSKRYSLEQDPLSPSSRPNLRFFLPRDTSQGLINNSKEVFSFGFDSVFNMGATQEEVFDKVAKPVVDSVLKGYNGTVFAYGQTGSGKTFTITGGAERYADRGLIPRSIQHIFKHVRDRDPHESISVGISYLEIYNESGYDLLDASRDYKKLDDMPKVYLQEDDSETIHIRNLSHHTASTEEEALNWLFLGDTNKMIAETPSNPASSRSHCIFIITVTSQRQGQDTIRRSKLHLVDLAGSERVSKTKIDGTILKEAKYINLSLHYLEQVIIALQEKSRGRSHIPYRNSMMTSILRDSLGGNCKTTMIATVATDEQLVDESIATCRFAQRVALIKQHANVNEEMDPLLVIERLKKQVEVLKAEIKMLKKELGRGGSEGDGDGEEVLPDYEKEKVRAAVDAYLQDTKLDAALVQTDFRKIQEANSIFKNYILELRKRPKASSSTSSEKLSRKSTSKQTAVDTSASSTSLNNLPPSDTDPEKQRFIEKLQQQAMQRDNEINILISMLKQKKHLGNDVIVQTGRVGHQDSVVERVTKRNDEENVKTSMYSLVLQNELEDAEFTKRVRAVVKELAQPSLPSTENVLEPATILKKEAEKREESSESIAKSNDSLSMRSVSVSASEKMKAFQEFKQIYPHTMWIEDQKMVLKEKYAEAKALGDETSSCRTDIGRLKSTLDKKQMQRMMTASDLRQPEHQRNQIVRDLDDDIAKAKEEMDSKRSFYKNAISQLKELKLEIEHVQHLLENARVRMQKEFEQWYVSQKSSSSQPTFETPTHFNSTLIPSSSGQKMKLDSPPKQAWQTPTPTPLPPTNTTNLSSNKLSRPPSASTFQTRSETTMTRPHNQPPEQPPSSSTSISSRTKYSYPPSLMSMSVNDRYANKLVSDTGSVDRSVLPTSVQSVVSTLDSSVESDLVAFYRARKAVQQQPK